MQREQDINIHRSLISLGSNLGDRQNQLQRARLRLEERCRIVRATSELDNPAVIVTDQPDFLNQIVEVETSLTPLALLAFLKGIEIDLGRQRRPRFGPREIDLDILTYDRLQMQSEDLTLPHPGLSDRPYLHALMAELEALACTTGRQL